MSGSPETRRRRESRLPDAETKRRTSNRVFRKYCGVLFALFVGVVLLLHVPLWLLHPPSAWACLLSLPPMLVCVVSWMAGAWWGWNRSPPALMTATLGLVPLRILVVLGWTGMALAVPGIPILVFVLAMMGHWLLFTVPELAMFVELSSGPAGPCTGRGSPR